MPAPRSAKAAEPFSLPGALLRAFEINDRINAYLIEEGLSDEAWSAEPPVAKDARSGPSLRISTTCE